MLQRKDWLMPIVDEEFCPECFPFFGPDDLRRIVPPVDIYEDEKNLYFKMELPEISTDDVKINVSDGVLTITGERDQEKEDKNLRYHRRERLSGEFKRSFRLPEWADMQNIQAESGDGILKISIQKKEETKKKKIQVKVK